MATVVVVRAEGGRGRGESSWCTSVNVLQCVGVRRRDTLLRYEWPGGEDGPLGRAGRTVNNDQCFGQSHVGVCTPK